MKLSRDVHAVQLPILLTANVRQTHTWAAFIVLQLIATHGMISSACPIHVRHEGGTGAKNRNTI